MNDHNKDTQTDSENVNELSKRRFDRVNINLPVAIHSPKSPVFLSKTLDVSEGGLLAENNGDNNFTVGDEVKVHIEGILSEESSGMVLHKMVVTRINDEMIALEFL